MYHVRHLDADQSAALSLLENSVGRGAFNNFTTVNMYPIYFQIVESVSTS